jgi:hypothetical protein
MLGTRSASGVRKAEFENGKLEFMQKKSPTQNVKFHWSIHAQCVVSKKDTAKVMRKNIIGSCHIVICRDKNSSNNRKKDRRRRCSARRRYITEREEPVHWETYLDFNENVVVRGGFGFLLQLRTKATKKQQKSNNCCHGKLAGFKNATNLHFHESFYFSLLLSFPITYFSPSTLPWHPL